MRLPAGKVIITAALNGAFVRKENNPNVPEQPDEIARAAAECYDAGAAIVHIHARDEQGKPCGTREKFAEIMAAVRGKCSEIIIQFSTGGGSNLTIEERVALPRGEAGDGVSQHGHAHAPDRALRPASRSPTSRRTSRRGPPR